jgi:hypothetical protein
MCHPFELAWAACSCFAPQNVRAIRLVGLFHLMGGGAPRWMMVVSRCRRQLARWRRIPTHHVPPLSVCLSVCLSLWRPWFSMSLRRLDSADQWAIISVGTRPRDPRSAAERLPAGSEWQTEPAVGLDIGLKHRIRALPRRTRSQSRHITRRRYNLQTHVRGTCTMYCGTHKGRGPVVTDGGGGRGVAPLIIAGRGP